MPRKSFSTGPTGTNRISLDAQHLVRYWRAELRCSENELRDAVAAVGSQAADVRRYLERQRRAAPQVPAQHQGAHP
jgi:hypothetical protein